MPIINKKYDYILDKLTSLKNDFCARAIKLEFETEYTTQKDIYFAKKLALESGLDLIIKIGGCGSVHDIEQAEKISPQAIVAPMIESRYALEKFFLTTQTLCKDENLNENIALYFNLETICGFNNLDDMLNSPYINGFKGIVFGRSDFTNSLGQPSQDTDSKIILGFITKALKKIKNHDLELVIGGCISAQSKSFLETIDSPCFKKFETRKILFDKNLLNLDFEKGLETALEFELEWLKLKEQKTVFDKRRIAEITKRLNHFALI